MTKVYGTGAYDFKRHRVAEYPLESTTLPSSSITLSEIQQERLTKIAEESWTRTGGGKPFDPDVVKEIYAAELKVAGGGRKPVPLQRVMVLEVSQYLENYLWPNFDPEAASFEHVMSMILMINEKFRENVAAWICFHDREDLFKKFLQKVLRLKEGRGLTIAEKTNYLVFMINAFQSLEDGVVNKTVLSLAGLQSWHSLSYGRFQVGDWFRQILLRMIMDLCLQPDLIKKWKRSSKKWAAEAMSKGEQFDPSSSPEANFVRGLIEEFVEVLDHGVFADEIDDTAVSQLVDDSSVLYCERFMEFLIDMLNQLPTRRYLRPLVADIAVVAKCRLSVLYKHEKGKLFAQLVDLLQFYEKFEIKDHDGTQLTDDEALQFHYDLFMAFQLLAFKKIPKLRDVSLANIGSVHKSSDLRRRLSALSLEDLRDVVCSKLKLVSRHDPWADSKDFLTEVVVSSFEKQQSQKEAINALPLYPNEQIIVIPSINYSGEGCLALPKLNLQFLTLHDYLLRNVNLFRLESTYEIREDIQEAVPHLLAHINNEGETAFRGWSRMAVPINGFKIAQVKQPNIGEEKPASVTAEVTFSIKSYRTQIRSEWNSIKEHDVLFLLCIRPSFEPLGVEEAAKATVPQRLGLQYVRGCEVIDIRDEEGNLMNDFSGKVKRDEWKPPKGDMRTVTVALDAAQ
ncbi:hypothetical protein YC2023_055665 [Brassica napus]